MADSLKPDVTAEAAKPSMPKPPAPQNPVFRAMGLPNFKWRLPSRNWMIFWTITGSFTGAVLYDKRQKKAVQKKWCDLVAHVAQQPLPVNQMPRKITIYLSASPGDGIGPSRQYFKDYIKPVLVAAAMDYDVIEGRKEGDVRYGTAEQIRRFRRKRGELGATLKEEELDATTAIELQRESHFITQEPGLRGDLVLGRHTWKEYIRGIHEGWLGPLDEPISEPEAVPEVELKPVPPPPSDEPQINNPVASLTEAVEVGEEEKKEQEEKKPEEPEKKKPTPPASYLPVVSYSSSQISQHIPQMLEPSAAIHQQHLLGFLKTPQRVYNFLNRRKLADDLGRQTAAIVLGAWDTYEHNESFASTSTATIAEQSPQASQASQNEVDIVQTGASYEQQTILAAEELYWHKSVRKPRSEDDKRERIWTSDIVLDPRIAERMRRFKLDSEEEERANRIISGAEKTRAKETQDLTQVKVIVGDVEDA